MNALTQMLVGLRQRSTAICLDQRLRGRQRGGRTSTQLEAGSRARPGTVRSRTAGNSRSIEVGAHSHTAPFPRSGHVHTEDVMTALFGGTSSYAQLQPHVFGAVSRSPP